MERTERRGIREIMKRKGKWGRIYMERVKILRNKWEVREERKINNE